MTFLGARESSAGQVEERPTTPHFDTRPHDAGRPNSMSVVLMSDGSDISAADANGHCIRAALSRVKCGECRRHYLHADARCLAIY